MEDLGRDVGIEVERSEYIHTLRGARILALPRPEIIFKNLSVSLDYSISPNECFNMIYRFWVGEV